MRWTRPSLAVIATALLATSCSAGAGSTTGSGGAAGASAKETSPLTAVLGSEQESAARPRPSRAPARAAR